MKDASISNNHYTLLFHYIITRYCFVASQSHSSPHRHKSCVDMVKEKIDTDAANVLAAMLVAARPFEHEVGVSSVSLFFHTRGAGGDNVARRPFYV